MAAIHSRPIKHGLNADNPIGRKLIITAGLTTANDPRSSIATRVQRRGNAQFDVS